MRCFKSRTTCAARRMEPELIGVTERWRSFLAAIVLVGVLGATPGHCAGPAASVGAKDPVAVISFQPSVEVKGRMILLRDIALVEAVNAPLRSRLQEVEVGS